MSGALFAKVEAQGVKVEVTPEPIARKGDSIVAVFIGFTLLFVGLGCAGCLLLGYLIGKGG